MQINPTKNMKILSTLFLLFLTFQLSGQTTYIHCGKLVDTENKKVLKEMTIQVKDQTVLSVDNGYISPTGENDILIDLKKQNSLAGSN